MQRAGAWTAVWAPISLATIAGELIAAGVECELDDCIIEGLSEPGLLSRLRASPARLFVINTATPSIVSDLALADRLKSEFPEAKVLAIGIHVSALPEESLAMAPGLDGAVIGEPELTVREAALAIAAGKSLLGVPGLIAREQGQIVRGPDRPPADLDALAEPAWELVKRDLYRLPFSGRPFLLLGTSRGCPFHCAFCADPVYYGHALRLKSPERIVAELSIVRDRFGIRDFLFWSESFTLKPDWTRAVLQAIIQARLDVRFVVNSRADHVDPELLSLLKAAGCWMIGFGLESGSQRVLDLMNKRLRLEQNREAVIQAKSAGLQVTAHLVLGYPGETAADLQETIALSCSLPLDFAQFYCAVPFPGSPLYQEAREKGWLSSEGWDRFEQNFSVLNTAELSADEVMAWRRRAYRRFYSRPSRVWRVLRHEVGFTGAPRLARMIFAFREWM
jgi:radical SAM superfamily enzyme YgiQ (UPF0313 family)